MTFNSLMDLNPEKFTDPPHNIISPQREKKLTQLGKQIAGIIERAYIKMIAQSLSMDYELTDENLCIGFDAIFFDRTTGKKTLVELKRRNFSSEKYLQEGLILEENKLKSLKSWQSKLFISHLLYIQCFTDNCFIIFNLDGLSMKLFTHSEKMMNRETANINLQKVHKKIMMLKYQKEDLTQVQEWPQVKDWHQLIRKINPKINLTDYELEQLKKNLFL